MILTYVLSLGGLVTEKTPSYQFDGPADRALAQQQAEEKFGPGGKLFPGVVNVRDLIPPDPETFD